MSKRIGIYSGTFDPIHDGHIAFADEALKRFGLDKVFFLAEPRPRRKQGVKSFEHRVEMVRKALKNHPQFGQIVLEQQRFTPHETLPILAARFKGAQLYMLIGDDVLYHLADWPHVEELIDACEVIVGVRGDLAETEEQLRVLTKVRSLPLKHHAFVAAKPEYASSAIRASLRRGKEPAGLNPSVKRYIARHGLYTPQSD